MNRRLQQFLAAENISQSQFADSIGVARASVSHIIAGRNKPGFDFIERMSKRYPTLNLEWLINGKGKMYSGHDDAIPTSAVETTEIFPSEENNGQLLPIENTPEEKHAEQPPISTVESGAQSYNITNQHNISKIIIMFDDGTYQEMK